jgi:RNA-directed DNA polymerase
MMHGRRKSDSPIVPGKSPNNDGGIAAPSAEAMEGRGLAKGNSGEQTRSRAQCRSDLQNALARVRQAAKRDSGLQFTTLWHHVYDVDRLREAYLGLKRRAAPGVDSVTWETYGRDLEAHLRDLSARLKRGAYRARPVKRTYIPKADGRQRPLGVTTLEDKIVQRATVEVLNAVYETDFLGFSYGFRPGRSAHMALDALAEGIHTRKVNWVLDADISGFFDTINHEWLMRFVEHRIRDKRVLRHIKKWLNAGVLEDGKRIRVETGTPQGASISPLLANIYLHYVFDRWAQRWRRRRAQGEVTLVRFADDSIVGFQYKVDAERFLEELRERLAEFSLELHPTKTRLIEFGRFAAASRRRRGQGKPETFNFLGFTHICSNTRQGKFVVLRQTMRTRLQAKLKEMKQWLREHLHDPISVVGPHLARVVRGHLQYFAVPLNWPALVVFRDALARLWYRTLRRRSQKHRLYWPKMRRLVRRYLPLVRIVHPYPDRRLAVMTQGRSRMR